MIDELGLSSGVTGDRAADKCSLGGSKAAGGSAGILGAPIAGSVGNEIGAVGEEGAGSAVGDGGEEEEEETAAANDVCVEEAAGSE